jgi:hypothetical protein
MGPDGHVAPYEENLEKLFMRKPGLPLFEVRFPDGSERPYWNTFYQEVVYHEVTAHKLLEALQIVTAYPGGRDGSPGTLPPAGTLGGSVIPASISGRDCL